MTTDIPPKVSTDMETIKAPLSVPPQSEHEEPMSPIEHNLETIGTADADIDTTPDYPTGFKLAIIIVGLCLSIFCLALVWKPPLYAFPRGSMHRTDTPSWRRIPQSLLLLYRGLQTRSTLCK